MVANCCVCGIERGTWRDFNLTFHSFPKNEDLRLKWYEAIGKKVYSNARICSKHFKIEDYKNHEDLNLTRRLLKPSAIPSNVCRELKSVESSLPDNTVNISIENNESVKFVNCISSENRNDIIENETNKNELQVNESNTSINISNSTKKFLNHKAISSSIANQQTEKRKTEDCTLLQSLEKQKYQNISGIMKKEDFTNVNAWLRFQRYSNRMRKRYTFLLHKNRRLHHKLNNFQDILDTLKTS